MARPPKPWFWKARQAWYVTIDGTRHLLDADRETAQQRFHALMAQPERQVIRSDSVAAILDLFLDWTERNRAAKTYRWYRDFLQAFLNSLPPNLRLADLKPFHVQRWVDAVGVISDSTRRGMIGSVKRAVHWAVGQGYLDRNPLTALEKPAVGRRERIISPPEYEAIIQACRDDRFRDLVQLAWETGARPQELTHIEVRHVDTRHARWVIPQGEAKGKRRPRIIYLSELAEEISTRLMREISQGRLLRNAGGDPWSSTAINSRWRRLSKTLDTKYCLYHFRHTFATRKLQEGLDPLTVAELLGHSDPSMLAKVYQHLSHDPEHMLHKLRRSAD